LLKMKKGTRELPSSDIVPDSVGTYLVTELKMEPDYVWRLKAVKHYWPNEKKVFHFRVYDEKITDKQGLKIEDYTSLDNHRDLILFQGVCDSAHFKVVMKDEYNVAKFGEIY
jgi:hypothetical protein